MRAERADLRNPPGEAGSDFVTGLRRSRTETAGRIQAQIASPRLPRLAMPAKAAGGFRVPFQGAVCDLVNWRLRSSPGLFSPQIKRPADSIALARSFPLDQVYRGIFQKLLCIDGATDQGKPVSQPHSFVDFHRRKFRRLCPTTPCRFDICNQNIFSYFISSSKQVIWIHFCLLYLSLEIFFQRNSFLLRSDRQHAQEFRTVIVLSARFFSCLFSLEPCHQGRSDGCTRPRHSLSLAGAEQDRANPNYGLISNIRLGGFRFFGGLFPGCRLQIVSLPKHSVESLIHGSIPLIIAQIIDLHQRQLVLLFSIIGLYSISRIDARVRPPNWVQPDSTALRHHTQPGWTQWWRGGGAAYRDLIFLRLPSEELPRPLQVIASRAPDLEGVIAPPHS